MTTPRWEPLPREEVVAAIERRSPSRIPLVRAKWWGEGLGHWSQVKVNHRLSNWDVMTKRG